MNNINQEIPAFWANDFNRENILNYAKGARELSEYLRVLFEGDYDSVVIPSRGAWPLFKAAQAAWDVERRLKPKRTMSEIQNDIVSSVQSPFHRVTTLPFSADVGSERQKSASIRSYWSQVLAALVRREGTAPQLVAYRAVVEHLAHRNWLDVLPRNLPSEKFIFIDTVLSGRAVCEIIKALDIAGMNQCYYLLIVDKSDTIKGEYLKTIERLEAAGRCTRINIERLFTEDRGPAVSGIWSTVYPQFLEEFETRFSWAKDAYGAGSFYHRVSSAQDTEDNGIGNPEYNMPVTKMYGYLSSTIFQAIVELQSIDEHLAANPQLGESEKAQYKERKQAELNARIERLIFSAMNDIRGFKYLNPQEQETTRQLAEPRVTTCEPTATVEISGSHLVRVFYPPKLVNEKMEKIAAAVALCEDVLADEYFRK